jgi:hypothetical protein
MRHQMDLLVASKQMNNMMQVCGLKPDYKVFIDSIQSVSFEAKKLPKTFLLNIIEKSKSDKLIWIPVIKYAGKTYASPEIKEVSTGKKIMFINQEQ